MLQVTLKGMSPASAKCSLRQQLARRTASEIYMNHDYSNRQQLRLKIEPTSAPTPFPPRFAAVLLHLGRTPFLCVIPCRGGFGKRDPFQAESGLKNVPYPA